MNDDVAFDVRVFDLVDKLITEKNGMIGPNNRCLKHFLIDSPEMVIEPCKKFTHGYGCLFFIHKKNFLKIPDEMLINFGDVWLYDYNCLQKRQNYEINKFCLKTKMNTSTSLFNEITDKEDMMYDKIFSRLTEKEKKGKLLSEPLIHDLTIDLDPLVDLHNIVKGRLGINA
jgi:hypothetical protein